MQQFVAAFGPGSYVFMVGERAVGKWRWWSESSAPTPIPSDPIGHTRPDHCTRGIPRHRAEGNGMLHTAAERPDAARVVADVQQALAPYSFSPFLTTPTSSPNAP